MNFLYDLDTDKLMATRGGSPITKLSSVSGSQSEISVGFFRGAEPKKPAFHSLWFGFVTDEGDAIALTDSWTYNPATQSFVGVFTTNTEEVSAALGASDSIIVYAQLIWKLDAEDDSTKSQVIEVDLRKSVLGFDTGTPLPLPTPAVWLAQQLANASDKTTPVDADTFPISDSEASDALKKLSFANLWTWVLGKSESLFIRTTEQPLSSGQQSQARVNVALGNVDNTSDADKPISIAQQAALDGKIDAMIDLEVAPVATVTSISVLYPGATVPVVLIPASLPLTGDPYEDVDGRTPYTEDGTFELGGFYNNRINYSALVSQWAMTLDGGEGVVGWDSNRADLTANGVESWPWTSSFEISVPTITPAFTTDAPGIAGQRYRVRESQGRYRHYEKQPDNSIRDLGLFDTLGNEFVEGTILRKVPAGNIATYVPLENEQVIVADTGCTATGDGTSAVKYLPWAGPHRINLNEDYLDSALAEDLGAGRIVLFSNSGDVEVRITEDVKALGANSLEILDYSRSSPFDSRFSPINFKYSVSCEAAQTGGSIQFVKSMYYWDRTANIYNSGTETAALENAQFFYDYVDLPSGSHVCGMGQSVIFATTNAVFGSV